MSGKKLFVDGDVFIPRHRFPGHQISNPIEQQKRISVRKVVEKFGDVFGFAHILAC